MIDKDRQQDPESPVTPREILTFPPGETVTLSKADFPWLVAARVHLKGGDAPGDGNPGDDGYAVVELYDQDPRSNDAV